MDETMPKLPRYVFRRANGSYRYKRNVPKALVPLLGKRTIYRQLGTTYADAMKEFPYVHARIEAMFEGERKKSDRERALEVIRGNLGDEVADMVLAKSVPEYSHVDYELNDLAKRLDGLLPNNVVEQIYQGTLKEDPVTLTGVLEEYLAFKSVDGQVDRALEVRVMRLRREMEQVYGKTKLDVVPISEINRQDANDLRDVLASKLAPNSVTRTLGILKAALNHTITEHGLNMPNVFARLRVKGAGSQRSDRLPISDDQLQAIAPAYSNRPDIHTLFISLADTGCRLAEIVGLEARDVDLEAAVLHIRPNNTRGLKTRASERSIPLSRRATELLRGMSLGLSDTSPIFPSYARPRGSDAASAMLMKRLRTVISDRKVTIHSLRHRMKDKLRNSGCPEALSMEILGHSQGTVAANYGSGYALEVMREAMERVWLQ